MIMDFDMVYKTQFAKLQNDVDSRMGKKLRLLDSLQNKLHKLKVEISKRNAEV